MPKAPDPVVLFLNSWIPNINTICQTRRIFRLQSWARLCDDGVCWASALTSSYCFCPWSPVCSNFTAMIHKEWRVRPGPVLFLEATPTSELRLLSSTWRHLRQWAERNREGCPTLPGTQRIHHRTPRPGLARRDAPWLSLSLCPPANIQPQAGRQHM